MKNSIPPALLVPLLILFFTAPSAFSHTISSGQQLYENRCARCHGFNGQGSLDAAKTLKVDPLSLNLTKEKVVRISRKELERLIGGGHGKMPKQESLSQKQIQSVIKYLQTLQKAYVLKKDPAGR